MPLSWNDIRHRAIKYSREWKSAVSEKSERQTFWNDFFEALGKNRCAVSFVEVTCPIPEQSMRNQSRFTSPRGGPRSGASDFLD
jgi:hypothetical protein